MSNNSRKTIIRILGSGPAGLTAAITLARAGHPVTVYERASNVGTRHQGDYEAIENWTVREDFRTEIASWGLQKNFRCLPIHELTCFGPGFKGTAYIEDSQPLFFVILRGRNQDALDQGLLAQALEVGVQVEFRRNERPEQVDIVATGFPRARAYVFGYTFRTNAQNASYMCLDAALTPNLYSYLIICEGNGTIGFGATTAPANINQTLENVVVGFRSRVRFEIESPRYFAAAGTFGLPESAQRAGRLYIGEAAELQDPLFGFGLRMSMATGYLAARSILDESDYDSLWQARLRPQLQAAAVHRMLFKMMGNAGYHMLLPYVQLFAHTGRNLLHQHYHPMWYTRFLWPLAKHQLLTEQQKPKTRVGQTQSLRQRNKPPTQP